MTLPLVHLIRIDVLTKIQVQYKIVPCTVKTKKGSQMCILFAFVNPKPGPGGYKIILASNRDESFSRPALPAHEWLPKHSGVYGGKFITGIKYILYC